MTATDAIGEEHTMTHLRSYSSPFNLGHKAVRDLFVDGTTVVQEKIDGSQFSFGIDKETLTFSARSKKQPLYPESDVDQGMFAEAMPTIRALRDKLEPGYTYRCEYLRKPKQNTLVYDRIPKGHIILFDVDKGYCDYMTPRELQMEGERLGLEVVPSWVIKKAPTLEQLEEWTDEISILGNVKREGVVFKRYDMFGQDKKVLMGKYVRPEFKEKNAKTHSKGKSIVAVIIEEYATEARWMKAVQHLREEGKLEGEMRDIPALLKEIGQDVHEECGEEISERLFKHFWKEIQRGLTRGMPEWYRLLLTKEALE